MISRKKVSYLMALLIFVSVFVLIACDSSSSDEPLESSEYSINVRAEVAEKAEVIPDVSIKLSGANIEPQTAITKDNGEVSFSGLKGKVIVEAADVEIDGETYNFSAVEIDSDYDGKTIIMEAIKVENISSSSELDAALADKEVMAINLADDITGDFSITRSIDIQGNNNKIQGTIIIDAEQDTIDLEDLIVEEIIIEAIGNESLNLKGETTIEELIVEGGWGKIDLAQQATIKTMKINREATGTIITGKSDNIELVTIKAEQVLFSKTPQEVDESSWYQPLVMFTAGEGGEMLAPPEFSAEEEKLGILFLHKSHYRRSSLTGQWSREVELKFLEPGMPHMFASNPPENYGADSYTIEYSTDGNSWFAYQNADGEDFTTTSDNVILRPGSEFYYRLRVNGGEKDGYVSNKVFAPVSNVQTRFTGWSTSHNIYFADEPYKKVYFSVEGGQDYAEYLSYQWYRVNPITLEQEKITGATEQKYYLTEDDFGYSHIIKATGDGEEVGGFSQVIDSSHPAIRNKAYVTDFSSEGFRIHLYQSLSEGLNIDDLEIDYMDDEYNHYELEIIKIEDVRDNAVFDVVANIPQEAIALTGWNTSQFWDIIIGEGCSGFYINLPPDFAE